MALSLSPVNRYNETQISLFGWRFQASLAKEICFTAYNPTLGALTGNRFLSLFTQSNSIAEADRFAVIADR